MNFNQPCLIYIQVIIQDKKAMGVEVIKEGRKHIVRNNKEVIMSAGVIGSAQILMLSGVGPRKHLQEHGVCITYFDWLLEALRNVFYFFSLYVLFSTVFFCMILKECISSYGW